MLHHIRVITFCSEMEIQLGDNCIQNFNLGLYFLVYMVLDFALWKNLITCSFLEARVSFFYNYHSMVMIVSREKKHFFDKLAGCQYESYSFYLVHIKPATIVITTNEP